MVLATSLRAAVMLARQGKVPTRRRRARLQAGWQFEQVLSQLGPGDIAIDCGANIGKFTRMMAQAGATVYAFEPDPHAFAELHGRLGALAHVNLMNKAVGAENDTVMLYQAVDYETGPTGRSVASSVFATKDNVNTDTHVTVQQIDLAAFIYALDRAVALLKVDIEGAEVPVIEKLIETGAIDRVENVFVETHEKRIPGLAERTGRLRNTLENMDTIKCNFDWR